MRCTSYCITSSFDFSALYQKLISTHSKESIHKYREVIHLSTENNEKDIFVFCYGCVVFWGFSLDDERDFLALLSPYEKDPLENIEIEEHNYDFAEKTTIGREVINLQSPEPSTKLSISYGLSQSIKLTVFEELTEATIQKTRSYPEELAKKGKISITKKRASKIMGQLMLQRNSINLHTEILDIPEFFWEFPDLEHLYAQTAGAFEIPSRVEILNKRLDIIKETFELLSNELNHQHSSFLEWIIIVLILIEVLFTLMEKGLFAWLGSLVGL
ncbi:MAG: sporulation protein RMD1 [Chlamydiales bacterium]|nr:RMD1 family protein [Chlamydiales bacterium]NCF70098.1 sporulation protein RMD1 [Chlamydiales bacterium]